MVMQRKRVQFNEAGPFYAKKNFSILDIDVHAGQTYAAEVLEYGLHARRVEQLFNSGHIDMAPADSTAKVHTLKSIAAKRPLDRDGDGKPGGRLTQVEIDALAAAGIDLDAFLALPKPERDAALAEALKAPVPPEATDDGGAAASGGGAEPETGATAPEAASGAETPPEGGEGAEIAPVAVLAAYKSFGFGRYWAINADGQSFGPKLGKAEATAFAARDNVPLLGMTDSLPGA